MGHSNSSALTSTNTAKAIRNVPRPQQGLRLKKPKHPVTPAKPDPPPITPEMLRARLEMYQEASYYTNGRDPSKVPNLLWQDCFWLALMRPDCVESRRTMFAHGIRYRTMYEQSQDPKFEQEFVYIGQMEFCRQRAIDHAKLRNEIREFATIQSEAIAADKHNVPDGMQLTKEASYDGIMKMIQYWWITRKVPSLEQVIGAIRSRFANNFPNAIPTEIYRNLLSVLLLSTNADLLDCLTPAEPVDFHRCRATQETMYKELCRSPVRLSLLPDSPSFLNKVTLPGRVLEHGLCSNGSFLFVLTKDRSLLVYRLYKGSIDELYVQYSLSQYTDIDDSAYMYCTREILAIRTSTTETKMPLDKLLSSESSCPVSKRSFPEDPKRLFSNGVSALFVSRDTTVLVDVDGQNIIWTRRIQTSLFSHVVSNGMFVAGIDSTGSSIHESLFGSHIAQVLRLHGIDGDICSVCLDMIVNTIYVVQCDDEVSTLLAFHNNGAADLSFLGIKTCESFSDEFPSSMPELLWSYMSHFAFSKCLPRNLLIDCPEPVKEIRKITALIDSRKATGLEEKVACSLILLLDLNLHKHNTREIASIVVETLHQVCLSGSEHERRLASMVFVNHFDHLVTDATKYQVVNFIKPFLVNKQWLKTPGLPQWIMQRLSYSKRLWQLELGYDDLCQWLGRDWQDKSLSTPASVFPLSFLLCYQESLVDEMVQCMDRIVDTAIESKIISVFCDYAEMILYAYHKYVCEHSSGQFDKNSLIFILVSNLFQIMPAAMECVQLAQVISPKLRLVLIQLQDVSCDDTDFGRFVGYLYLVYAHAISILIRGGITYKCEDEYWWLIGPNFYSGQRRLLPDEQQPILSVPDGIAMYSTEENRLFIENGDEQMNYIRSKKLIWKLKCTPEMLRYDKVIMSALCHQLGLIQQLHHVHENEGLDPHLRTVMDVVFNMRNHLAEIRQKINQNNDADNNIAKFDRVMKNLSLLLSLEPSLSDYTQKSQIEQQMYISRLKKFIYNNNADIFTRILDAMPLRAHFISTGFHCLIDIVNEISDNTFQKLLISGISRSSNFTGLERVLSRANMDLTPDLSPCLLRHFRHWSWNGYKKWNCCQS